MKRNAIPGTVAVHTCPLMQIRMLEEHLIASRCRSSQYEGEKYVCMDEDAGPKYKWYRQIPSKCSCRKIVTLAEADNLVEDGRAKCVWKALRHSIEIDNFCIWKPQSPKVPRIHMISATDIERAYAGDTETSIRNSRYIEAIHDMIMSERARWIVPFKEDPTEGRLLFPFTPDQRTKGGH